MTRRRMEVSRRRYLGTSDDGIRLYRLVCLDCRRGDTRGVPLTASVGLYFTYPLRCPHCGFKSIYYTSSHEYEEARSEARTE